MKTVPTVPVATALVIKLSNEARHCDETWYRGVSLHNEDRNDSFSTVIQWEIVFLQLFLAVERLIGKNESLQYYRYPDTGWYQYTCL